MESYTATANPLIKRSFAPRVRWAVWLIAFAGYTYLLLAPDEYLPPWLRHTVEKKITEEFTIGKMAHAITYACFTLATFLLPISWRAWRFCIVVLSLHGFATEYIQTYVPSRHGSWRDVGIDHVGIATGLVLGGLGCWLRRRGGFGRGA
jgi:VanZ family protein